MTSASVRHLNFLDEHKDGGTAGFSLNYFWILVIIVSLAAFSGGYSLVQKRRMVAIQAKLDADTAALERIKSDQAKMQQEKMNAAALKEVLNDPILWSKLIKKISKKIPASIKLVEISGEIRNRRTLVVKGTCSFLSPIFRLKENMSELKECHQAALVSLVTGGSSPGNDQLSFQIECTLI